MNAMPATTGAFNVDPNHNQSFSGGVRLQPRDRATRPPPFLSPVLPYRLR